MVHGNFLPCTIKLIFIKIIATLLKKSHRLSGPLVLINAARALNSHSFRVSLTHCNAISLSHSLTP